MDLAPGGLDADHAATGTGPGTMGRIGVLLGEADVNIQLDDPRPVRAARRRVHGPRARRRRPRGGRRVDPQRTTRSSTSGRSASAASGDRGQPRPTGTALIPEGLDATLVLLRHGESEWIREGRFQGQAETPLSDTGRRQAALAGERLAASARLADAARSPRGRPLEIVHSPLARTTETAALVAAAIAAGGAEPATARPCPCDPSPGSSRSGRATGRARHHDEIARRWTAELARVAAPAVTRRGRRAASRSPRSRRASRPALAAILERLGRDYPAGQPRPAPGRRLSRRRARRRPAVVDPRRPRRGVQGRRC